MKVVKASGKKVLYNPEKIVRSLTRVGVSPKAIDEVLRKTEAELYPGIHTKEMDDLVFKHLKSVSCNAASKYHLKRAISELGPTGFPFEKLIAALFEAEGYQALNNQMLEGYCVSHEVDVVAKNENEYHIMECKFHGAEGSISDIKHALYVYARFLDLARKRKASKQKTMGWLVTNTRFSSDAEKYGRCVGLQMLSWDYPKGGSLRERIDKTGLFPVTCLTMLSKQQKQKLLNREVVLCRELAGLEEELKLIGLPKEKQKKALEEAHIICQCREL